MSSTHQQERRRLILVTGANRGIGYWIVKKLAEKSTPENHTTVLLGSRDLQRGQDAMEKLGNPSNVHLLQLDTTSIESISRATEEIKNKYGATLDVVINNAAVASSEITAEAAHIIFATNYYGVKLLNEHMYPLLKENGRIINVSSGVAGETLFQISEDIQNKYFSPTLTVAELDDLVKDFINAVETGTLEEKGYPVKPPWGIYGMAKAAVNALTQVEVRQWAASKNLVIACVTPGFCSTGLTSKIGSGGRPPELGAESILWAVNTERENIENGAFYRDGRKLPFIAALMRTHHS